MAYNKKSMAKTAANKAVNADKNTTVKNEKKNVGFVFGWLNYALMGAGIVLLLIGYVLLAGGGSDDPNVFNEEMFNTRRMVVSPIMIVLGFIVEIVAIMISPDILKKKSEKKEE